LPFHVFPVDQSSAETSEHLTSEENTSHDVRAQCTFTSVNKILVMFAVLSCEYLYSLLLSKVPKLSFILGFCWTR